MNTTGPKPSLEVALGPIPQALRERLLRSYSSLKKISIESEHDAIGVRAGKLAEILLRVEQHLLTGNYTPLSKGLGRFNDECNKLEQTPSGSGPEGLRIIMPRALQFLYTLRNKRDLGHAGGEVDANKIDSSAAVRIVDWCMCELIRVCHNIPLDDAQAMCDAITQRQLPWLWSVMGRKRILNTELSYSDQTLLLLYSEIEQGVPTEDLFAWTEHSHRTNYRRDVLAKLHSARFIEWDHETEMAIISPTGIATVETAILPKLRRHQE